MAGSKDFIFEDHLVLNENAQFFKRNRKIPKKAVEQLFSYVSRKKVGRVPIKTIRTLVEADGKNAHYSMLFFKEAKPVSFLDETHPDWQEEKFCYLIIIEYKNFLAIIKRNIAGLGQFTNQNLTPIDYQVLSRLFLSERTEYQALSLQNIDVSEYSTRNKSVRANDLRKSLSPFGTHRYIVSRMQVTDGVEDVALTFNTSRINKSGRKSYFEDLITSVIRTTDKIKAFVNRTTFLDSFATPVKFEDRAPTLYPIGVLFLWGELQEMIENGKLVGITISRDDDERNISGATVLRFLKKFNRLLTVKKVDPSSRFFTVEKIFDDQTFLAVNRKSIRIRSHFLRSITLRFENGGEESLLDRINRKALFLVSFSAPDTVYFSGKLFQDSRLLGSIDALKDVFIPYESLKSIKSEKGDFTSSSISFSTGSLFNFVEDELVDKDTEYLFCDDLGDEWADFIAVKSDRICLYHAKYKGKVGLSAASLQDVIGQAQKNLGNVVPEEERLRAKERSWQGTFKMDGVQTQITKMRKGDSITEGVAAYQKKLISPGVHIEVTLVINFISKKQLFDNLEALKSGNPVSQKAQVIQLLWFISSFVNSCKEIGLKPFIICQP